jgi:hypothetical protein
MRAEPDPSAHTPRRGRRIVRNAVALAAAAAFPLTACSGSPSDSTPAANRTEPSLSGTPSSPASVEATATVGPGRGTGYFAGSSPEVPLTFTMPPGWEADGAFVNKIDANPVFGLVFIDVANIYTDGCTWTLVDPPPGPTVDDLVAAYADLPELQPTPARDITIDGHPGKQIQIQIPDYDQTTCQGGKYGIFQENAAADLSPSLWAQAPQQQNTLSILDVDGTRLVILSGTARNATPQDRTDLDTILNSIQIG